MDSTTKKRSQRRAAKLDENDIDKRSLLFGSLLALLVAPITFHSTKSIEADSFKADILASILTLILTVLFSVLVNHFYHRQHGSIHQSKSYRYSNLEGISYSWRLVNGVCYYIYGQSSAASPRSKDGTKQRQNLNLSFDSQCGDDGQQKQSKIDPKYFKPKFIMHELMTFWDTTCTVITWGSFYVIGGTIVATEKLAQKIKTKRTRDTNGLKDSAHSTSTGRFDSFTSSFSSPTSTTTRKTTQRRQTAGCEHQGRAHHSLNKISSWTKRSYSSVKKKITRMTSGTNGVGAMPQIEESGGLLNTSFLSGSFRSN